MADIDRKFYSYDTSQRSTIDKYATEYSPAVQYGWTRTMRQHEPAGTAQLRSTSETRSDETRVGCWQRSAKH